MKKLDKEEEKDLTEAVVNKEISVSLNIIPDGYYKIMVGIIGCFICFYLIDEVINIVGVLLRGSGQTADMEDPNMQAETNSTASPDDTTSPADPGSTERRL